jgi:hypothetical protein
LVGTVLVPCPEVSHDYISTLFAAAHKCQHSQSSTIRLVKARRGMLNDTAVDNSHPYVSRSPHGREAYPHTAVHGHRGAWSILPCLRNIKYTPHVFYIPATQSSLSSLAVSIGSSDASSADTPSNETHVLIDPQSGLHIQAVRPPLPFPLERGYPIIARCRDERHVEISEVTAPHAKSETESHE